MRILHTSDWHLGRVLAGHCLMPDQEHALAQLEALLQRDPHDLLVIAGDIFDRASPAPEALNLLGHWIQRLRLAAPGMPVLITAGNHDNGTRLAWAAGLMDEGMYLRGDTKGVTEPLTLTTASGERAQIWALPFLEPGVMNEALPSQSGAMEAALSLIRPLQDANATQVLVAHCFVRDGAVSDSERQLVGTAVQIDPAVFAGFDYVALGHLHKPQRVAPNARYSGSLGHYSFSEAGHEKAFLSITVSAGVGHTCVEHPIVPLRRMSRITGSLQELLGDPGLDEVREHYVELTVEPRVREGNVLEQLRRRWPWLLSLKNDAPVVSTLTMVVATQSLQRNLVQDFLDFDAMFRGEQPPDQAMVDAFEQLLTDMHHEETAQ